MSKKTITNPASRTVCPSNTSHTQPKTPRKRLALRLSHSKGTNCVKNNHMEATKNQQQRRKMISDALDEGHRLGVADLTGMPKDLDDATADKLEASSQAYRPGSNDGQTKSYCRMHRSVLKVCQLKIRAGDGYDG